MKEGSQPIKRLATFVFVWKLGQLKNYVLEISMGLLFTPAISLLLIGQVLAISRLCKK